MTNKKEVQKLLEKLSKIDRSKIVTKENGHTIDMDKFYKILEVKQLIADLKKLGVKSLCKMGFVAAGLMLDRKLK